MNWKLIALLSPIPFVLFQSLSKTLPNTISPILIMGIGSIFGGILSIIIYLFENNKTTISQINLIQWLTIIGIGLLIVFGNILIIKAFTNGASQSHFTAIYNPLYITFGLLAGLIIWQEKITAIQYLGIAIIISGILLVALPQK